MTTCVPGTNEALIAEARSRMDRVKLSGLSTNDTELIRRLADALAVLSSPVADPNDDGYSDVSDVARIQAYVDYRERTGSSSAHRRKNEHFYEGWWARGRYDYPRAPVPVVASRDDEKCEHDWQTTSYADSDFRVKQADICQKCSKPRASEMTQVASRDEIAATLDVAFTEASAASPLDNTKLTDRIIDGFDSAGLVITRRTTEEQS